MKAFLRVLKKLSLAILALVLLFSLALVLFLSFSPQIGQHPVGEDLERISQSPYWEEDHFENLIPTSVGSLKDVLGTLGDYLNAKNTSPEDSLPVQFGLNDAQSDSLTYITWYGHSAFLFEMDGKKILIDPMLGDYSAPISFGSKRFPYKEAIPIEELKDIDAVILSHDHYDHLDYPSIMALNDEVGHFYTALGVGSHLKSWDIEADRITELDWWEEGALEDLKLVACPSRHFSGRSLVHRNSSQWASWVLIGQNRRIYFSGDGGYGPHFKEIGARYGPFDLAMMECGQYNEAWSEIHMMPEESVIAGMEVKGQLLMPIHWGAFQLALHSWTDPIVRFQAKAKEEGQEMIHPMIGERFALELDRPKTEWWLDL